VSGHAKMLAVIPARGGSKGLPGKNIRPFAGLPLIAHTILFARLCPEIDRCVVSTDSTEIGEIAKQFQADVPFTRPSELAQDDTPMLPVLQHALRYVESEEGSPYDVLLLLDPTSLAREPGDITSALDRLLNCSEADGVIGVSEPDFSPIWHCVVEEQGWMVDLMEDAKRYERRQDVPPVYWINGALYLWRTALVRAEGISWRQSGRYLVHRMPDLGAMSIDTPEQFRRAELLVNDGLVAFPWLK
jgi:CMP-N,N'-diacetyllegionaminic acid synthase